MPLPVCATVSRTGSWICMPKKRRKTPCAVKTVVCHSRSGEQQSTALRLVTGLRWEGRGTPEGYTPSIPAAAGAGISPACAGKTKQYFYSALKPAERAGRRRGGSLLKKIPDSGKRYPGYHHLTSANATRCPAYPQRRSRISKQ